MLNTKNSLMENMKYDEQQRVVIAKDNKLMTIPDIAAGATDCYGYGAMFVIRQLYDTLIESGDIKALEIIRDLKSGWAERIKHITFTGVDRWTDVNELVKLQLEFPKVEFGVLMSQNWNENTPRFCPPDFLANLEGKSLNLSLHLCGEVARQAIRNNFQPAIDLCQGHFGLFKRCQLNIASYDTNPETLELEIPESLDEVIIQQKGANDLQLFQTAYPNPKISVLLDNSGGRGIKSHFEVPQQIDQAKVGYAGGLNITNILHTLEVIILKDEIHPFWIDMESSVRTDDRFDTQKVIDILKLIRPLI